MNDEQKIIINTQGGPVITGGNFTGNVEFVANKYVMNEPSKTAMPMTMEVGEVEEVGQPSQIISDSAKACFRFPTDFVKLQVETLFKEFYRGENVEMALIEVTLYDHGQLKKRNNHTSFVRTLVDWGILPSDTNIEKMAGGMASKLRSPFPKEGYKTWNNNYQNERTLCTDIGKKLPESMKYNR